MKVFGILFLLINLDCLQAAVLIKAFYHRGQCEDKLVFYFDQNPQISKKSTFGKTFYELKNVKLEPGLAEILDQITHSAQNYQIKFDYQKQSLQIVIDFNNHVGHKIEAAKFKPISQPAGIVIKILHHQLTKSKRCDRLAVSKEVVLDFGHGGSDTGAMFGKICEKDIVRNVGLKLAKLLEEKGYMVYLTRLGDEFVSLDERTYFANLHTNASLFLSLHANHAPNKKISGLETYHMSDFLFNDLDQNYAKNNRKLINSHSANLANLVHASILQTKTRDYELIDRKVKQSVSQVLLGVEMPAILIELGFLSNSKEARQLNTPDYQMQLAQGICQGIISYGGSL